MVEVLVVVEGLVAGKDGGVSDELFALWFPLGGKGNEGRCTV